MWIQIESEDEGLGPTAESSSKTDCESHWTHKERILVPQEREKREIEGRNTTTPFFVAGDRRDGNIVACLVHSVRGPGTTYTGSDMHLLISPH